MTSSESDSKIFKEFQHLMACDSWTSG